MLGYFSSNFLLNHPLKGINFGFSRLVQLLYVTFDVKGEKYEVGFACIRPRFRM